MLKLCRALSFATFYAIPSHVPAFPFAFHFVYVSFPFLLVSARIFAASESFTFLLLLFVCYSLSTRTSHACSLKLFAVLRSQLAQIDISRDRVAHGDIDLICQRSHRKEVEKGMLA